MVNGVCLRRAYMRTTLPSKDRQDTTSNMVKQPLQSNMVKHSMQRKATNGETTTPKEDWQYGETTIAKEGHQW